MTEEQIRWFNGGLSEGERSELYALEYVLTWGYSEDKKDDERRYKELSNRLWNYRDNNPIVND